MSLCPAKTNNTTQALSYHKSMKLVDLWNLANQDFTNAHQTPFSLVLNTDLHLW